MHKQALETWKVNEKLREMVYVRGCNAERWLEQGQEEEIVTERIKAPATASTLGSRGWMGQGANIVTNANTVEGLVTESLSTRGSGLDHWGTSREPQELHSIRV